MRTLDQNEIANVSGGTFGLLSGLLGGLFGRNSYCAPKKPEPVCKPKKKGC